MADYPPGVRPLSLLTIDEAKVLGEEALALAQLAARGVPLAEGLLVRLRGEAPHRRLEEAVLRVQSRGLRLAISPLFPSRAVAARFERNPGMRIEVAHGDDAAARLAGFLDAMTTTEVRAALGGALSRLTVRVIVMENGAVGRAASADPIAGDPDEIRVWEAAANPWRVDRRTNRVIAQGEGRLDGFGASSVADLADRAQLALGRPAEVAFCRSRGRYTVTGVGPLSIRPSFTAAPFRIVALVASDEGTVAPLTIDTLDKALREDDSASDEAIVRRIYARPYRRMTAPRRVIDRRSGGDPVSVARASFRAARVARDVATPLAACRRFEQTLMSRLEALDVVNLVALDDDALVEHLRERQRLVIEAIRLLDRSRTATITVLAALEATIGVIPRECYPALASPRPTRTRRKIHERLARFAKKLEGRVPSTPRGLSRAQQKKWTELSLELARVRPLGIDVSPLPHGGHDVRLAAALHGALAEADEDSERNRRNALRRLLVTARGKSFGRTREGIVRSLGVMLSRVASTKGRVAEGLASSMLRLRAGAIEAGRRLEERGLVDAPADAFYLHVSEIEQGLMGEPGAYAARVLLRREDDERWRCYEAPRRIEGRRSRDR